MKKINELINRIRKLFILHDQNNENRIKNNPTYEVIKMEDLIPELKGLDHKAIYDSIKPGDIVIAATSSSIKTMVNVELSHRTRPYIVAKKDEKGIRAYCGTSKQNADFDHAFELSKNIYNLKKTGKINIGNAYTLYEGQIVRLADHLHQTDIIKINADILSNKEKTYHPAIDVNLSVKEGLILEKEQSLFYVYKVSREYITLFEMTEDKNDPVSIRFNEKQYYIDPEQEIRESDLRDYRQLGFKSRDENTIGKIEKHFERRKIRYVPVNSYADLCEYNYPVGQVFKSRNCYLVYLFSVNGNDFGVDEDEVYDGQPVIKKLNNLIYCRKEEVLSDEVLEYIVEEIAGRFYNYVWLRDIVSKEVATA